MSDPFIRANQPNLGSQRPSSTGKATAKNATPSDAQVAEAHLRSSGQTGTREKLNHFLSKLETTWKLFNRSSTDAPDGELPQNRMALLDEGDAPTPETLKNLRARFKESARKPDKSANSSLYRSASPEQKTTQQKPNSPSQGPKPSPASDRNTPKPPGGKLPQAQAEAAPRSQPQAQPKASPTPREAPKPPASKPAPEQPPQQKAPAQESARKEARAESQQRFEGPRVQKETTRRTPAQSSSSGSVLGRKPGSTASKSLFSQPKSTPQPDAPQSRAQNPTQAQPKAQPQAAPQPQRGPQLLRRPGSPQGQATPGSFLGSSQSSSNMRSSDAAGRPGRAAETALARQPVFSQSIAQVSSGLKKRQVSSQMPVHNSFLDECHEGEKKDSGPIRLNWNSAKGVQRSTAQRMFAHRARLQLTRGGQGGQSMGNPINLSSSAQPALASARTDMSTRVAGAAIGSLLKDLYDEEEVENLDEETAVTSLGLILRLGGEFTYKHSTRVLDLALELADEVGIRDKQTRKEIKFGTMLRDLGEFDMLLQGSPKAGDRLEEFSDFLQGQDMLRAGLLHDIGKVKIPPEILYKPGKLTPEEYEIMKMHPIWGEEIVRPIASLRYLCPTIRGHHERWDGKGYPDGLVGESIPLAARIISVADVFDALAAERPYKRGMEVKKVTSILSEGRGSHFDPFLVDAFLQVLGRRYPD
ncbi:MAG: HD domain-containing phosphohydrolase [Vulcanimicrobiota bacterium]